MNPIDYCLTTYKYECDCCTAASFPRLLYRLKQQSPIDFRSWLLSSSPTLLIDFCSSRSGKNSNRLLQFVSLLLSLADDGDGGRLQLLANWQPSFATSAEFAEMAFLLQDVRADREVTDAGWRSVSRDEMEHLQERLHRATEAGQYSEARKILDRILALGDAQSGKRFLKFALGDKSDDPSALLGLVRSYVLESRRCSLEDDSSSELTANVYHLAAIRQFRAAVGGLDSPRSPQARAIADLMGSEVVPQGDQSKRNFAGTALGVLMYGIIAFWSERAGPNSGRLCADNRVERDLLSEYLVALRWALEKDPTHIRWLEGHRQSRAIPMMERLGTVLAATRDHAETAADLDLYDAAQMSLDLLSDDRGHRVAESYSTDRQIETQ